MGVGRRRYILGIGTIQAFNTVSVRARIDGEIRRVLFREGQDVRRGEALVELVELDGRPFEAQLRSVIAQREKDQAQLENAKIDLGRYEFLAKTDSASGRAAST
jgi:multidrug efflux system membrane fusion protein